MKILVAALAAALALPAAARETLQARRLPAATLVELAARPEPPRRQREVRHEKRERVAAPYAIAPGQKRPLNSAAAVAPPPIVDGFASTSSGRVSPADASGAVGPNHVVGMFNSGLVVQDRSGKILGQLSLNQFWAESSSAIETYDPRIAYDKLFDRWVAISIKDEHSMLLAASQSGDPTGAWTRYTLKIEQGGGIDFSRLALTRDTVLFVTERVSFASCIIFAVQKSDLYAGNATIPVQADDTSGSSSLVVPVANDESDVDYLIHALFVGAISVKRFDEFQWRSTVTPIVWEPGWFFANQRDTSVDLDFGFDEIQNAVMRNGVIYASHLIGVPEGKGRTAAVWWKIAPEPVRVVAYGVVDDGRTFYGFPSLAVNRAGQMVMGYAAVSNLEHPSARYVFIDPAGKTSSEAKVTDGDSSIRHTDRWGDYTTTVVDPMDDSLFWTVQIRAHDGVWQTSWAKVKAPAPTNRRRSARH